MEKQENVKLYGCCLNLSNAKNSLAYEYPNFHISYTITEVYQCFYLPKAKSSLAYE